VPADGPHAGRVADGGDGAGDDGALVFLGHVGVALPAIGVRADLVAAGADVAGEPGRALERTGRSAERRLDAAAVEQVGEAPVGGAGAVLEMALHQQVRRARDLVDDLVDALAGLVAVGEAELGALLDVHHERDREPRPARPARVERRAAVAPEIPRRQSEAPRLLLCRHDAPPFLGLAAAQRAVTWPRRDADRP